MIAAFKFTCTAFILALIFNNVHSAQILGIRFVPGTGILSDGRDGIIEILGPDGITWGTVCTIGFDTLDASVACIMLGYPRKALVVSNPANTRVPSNPIAMEVNCPANATSFSNCLMRYGTSNVNAACNSPSYMVHVACLEPKEPVAPPSPQPIPSTYCNTSSSVIQLYNGTNLNNGLLKISRNNVWYSVCSVGFDTNAAKAICKTLCLGNGTDYARPVYNLGPGDGTTGTRLQCSSGATNLADCTTNFDSTICNNRAYAAAVDCGPMTASSANYNQMSSPILECRQPYMIVTFNFTTNPDLTQGMISVKETNVTATCPLSIDTASDNSVVITIPLENCNAFFQQTKDDLFYTYTIHRMVRPDSNNVYSAAPVDIRVTCKIPRNNSVSDDAIGAQINTLAPLINTDTIPVSINLYTDAIFQSQVLDLTTKFEMGQRLYAMVKTTRSLNSWLLTLTKCWLTPTNDGSASPQLVLIDSQCAVQSGVILQPINNTAMSFSFKVVQFSSSATVNAQSANDFRSIYLHCNTRVCDVNTEGYDSCNRLCQGTTAGRRRKRDVSDVTRGKVVNFGPIFISSPDNGSGSIPIAQLSIMGILSTLLGFLVIY